MAVASTETFNPLRVDAEVCRAHLDYETRTERDRYLADPDEVGDYAAQLARRHYDLRPRATNAGVHFAAYAGKCVYAMDHYGWSFLDLCRHATIAVARIVSAVSADIRLNMEPMWKKQLRALAKADADAQIVRMAEILASAERLADDRVFSRAQCLVERENILLWIRHQDAQFSCLKNRLFADPKFGPAVDRVEDFFAQVYAKIQRPRGRDARELAGCVLVGVGASRVAVPANYIPSDWYDAGPALDSEDDDENVGSGIAVGRFAALIA